MDTNRRLSQQESSRVIQDWSRTFPHIFPPFYRAIRIRFWSRDNSKHERLDKQLFRSDRISFRFAIRPSSMANDQWINSKRVPTLRDSHTQTHTHTRAYYCIGCACWITMPYSVEICNFLSTHVPRVVQHQNGFVQQQSWMVVGHRSVSLHGDKEETDAQRSELRSVIQGGGGGEGRHSR